MQNSRIYIKKAIVKINLTMASYDCISLFTFRVRKY